MTPLRSRPRPAALWFGVLALALAGLLGCSGGPTTTTQTTTPPVTTTPPASTTAPGPMTIDLIAQNMAFNMSTITVPAGAKVKVNFDNKDSGVQHNFAVYQNQSGGGTKAIFVGQNITGPATTTYTFTAPAAGGSYFFECDVHPSQMNGQFIVQ